jgi:nitrile hydratase subunit alpha
VGREHEHDRYPVAEDDVELRVKALEALLYEKGLISSDAVDRIASHYEDDVGPRLGARVVARAWVDSDFKERLLRDATSACAELGVGGLRGEHLRVLENGPDVHNVVVCTLCSCYPWPVLGLPPSWYKSPEYRARVVMEPRRTLWEDFGVDVDDNAEIRVWDSNSELRYFVLPRRPEGTEDLTEDELAALVTREAMIGVAEVAAP